MNSFEKKNKKNISGSKLKMKKEFITCVTCLKKKKKPRTSQKYQNVFYRTSKKHFWLFAFLEILHEFLLSVEFFLFISQSTYSEEYFQEGYQSIKMSGLICVQTVCIGISRWH